ncbi:MAG: type II toxin-antitoxin system RelE/ParE family toxin [Melioribacteraceae bacterium]|nr:type II toxin-antitoxin system RelE/ParE family toxin [Melioribacteraceae bacterium]MCF8356743.1 type II toxin-antitoxin system RelE/ParE family toxin [Melioribacteraceae bacterium]MCF8395966.1 type II toxin-antitoxin system RelE/ParE family toxin [Melioribacteraceae bacterium]MCF8419529.1 type II toxin-antitoxin system RelE/ParE family toxin [Melioribacteraceae bacterium]
MDFEKRLVVRFYKTELGKEPVRDLLQKLDKQAKKIIGEDIKTVQYGWPLGMPLVRKLEAGLWEVRSNLENKIVRIIFTVINKTIILLHGFIKKSTKIPKTDIELARKRLSDLRRNK